MPTRVEIGRGVCPRGANLYKKVEFFLYFRGRIPTPCTDWGEILHSQVDQGARWTCQVSRDSVQRVAPCWTKNLIFHLWVNLIPAACTSQNPVGKNKNSDKHHIFAPTAGACCTIFPKLCMVIEDVKIIKKGTKSFFDPTHSFSYRCMEKFEVNARHAVSQQ